MLRRIFLFWLCAALLVGAMGFVPAKNADLDVFLETDKVGTRKMPADKTVMRTRTVEINWTLLDKLSSGEERFARLPLFDGVEYDITITEVERREVDCYSLFASVNGNPDSLLILTREHDALAVTLRVPGGIHTTLKNVGNGVFLVAELDDTKFPPCGGGLPCGEAAPVPPRGGFRAQETTRFTVLMLYTQSATSAAGGTNQIRAIAQQAIDVSNTSYANSGLDVRAVLAERLAVTYDESSGFDDALDALTSTTDGVLDQVHAWRDQYQADLVSMLINNGQYCGLAWLSPTNQARGFSTVNWSCAADNLSSPHEMGHNMGCGHDAANGNGVFAYSHGWRFNTSSGQLRTVMAYAPGTRVAVFSSPLVTYQSVVTGNAATADNVRTIRETINGISLFRNDYFVDGLNGLDTNPGSASQPLKTVTQAINLAPSFATSTRIFIKARNYNERPRITKKVSLRNWGNTGLSRIGAP